ncbi:hypothetical protein DL765_003529 [Monosporascus sp. GIB2]|nr:hypothetical protein DL765_003529 [Monosporascus sp. GIB2]
MRLINVKTSEFEEFPEHRTPSYAILSHTWGSDIEELTFRDVEKGITKKPGVGSIKLQGCCQQAMKDRVGYIWIDTCCIDKTNSVELGEAINSMFRWYQRASVCYAYLSDVPGDQNPREEGSKFRTSRWFRRGWTLQELLAPKRLFFYSSDWYRLGAKAQLRTVIEEITGIPKRFLTGGTNIESASVAQHQQGWAYDDGDFADVDLELVDVVPRFSWHEGRSVIIPATESDGSTVSPTLVRLRHEKEGSRDFILILELKQHDTHVKVHHCVAICSRDTPSEELAGKLRPEIMLHPPDVTVDATIEFLLEENATWQLRRTLEGYKDSVNSVTFSHNSKLLAAGSDDRTVRLWDPATGQLRRTLGHKHIVWSVAFSRDSKLLASGSEDSTVRLWDPATGQLLRTLEGHKAFVCTKVGNFEESEWTSCRPTILKSSVRNGPYVPALLEHEEWKEHAGLPPVLGKMIGSRLGSIFLPDETGVRGDPHNRFASPGDLVTVVARQKPVHGDDDLFSGKEFLDGVAASVTAIQSEPEAQGPSEGTSPNAHRVSK